MKCLNFEIVGLRPETAQDTQRGSHLYICYPGCLIRTLQVEVSTRSQHAMDSMRWSGSKHSQAV